MNDSSAPLSRRHFLASATLGSLALAAALRSARALAATFEPSPAPFTLGVASGDPTHDSVVLWTRLANDPLNGGGMGPDPIPVDWEVGLDEHLSRVIRRGTALARAGLAHSVHVHVRGLPPDRWFWYRFRAGRDVSPIGRTRTLPPPGADAERMHFAFVSCQNFEDGFYSAYANLLEEDVDFDVHLGDYIYENGPTPGRPRRHVGGEATTLEDYRNRHALYKSDAALQAVNAAFPLIATWDDHEVENNYAGDISEDNGIPDRAPVPPERFRARRANAYQAYFEHLPLGPATAPAGPSARLFRRFRFGRLATIHVLDTRQFRSNQPCEGDLDQLPPAGDDVALACGQELNPQATMMGSEQEAWLFDGLDRSPAQWNVIAQQVMMTRGNFAPTLPVPVFNMDAWDGYAAARNRLLGFIAAHRPSNPVVITGDIHSSWVADLRTDFAAPDSPVVATELVGTSISSSFAPELIPAVQAAVAHPANAHVKFFEGAHRGYVRCDLDRERWQADFRVVASTLTPSSPVRTLASFVIEDGRAGAVPA